MQMQKMTESTPPKNHPSNHLQTKEGMEEQEPGAVTIDPPGVTPKPLRERRQPDPFPSSTAPPPSDPVSEDSLIDSAEPIRSTPTSTKRAPFPVDEAKAGKSLSSIIQKVVTMIGFAVHQLRTPGPVPVWIPSAAEAQAIADPLGRILARRVPDGAGNPDIADGMDAVVATGAYGARHFADEKQYKALSEPTNV